MSRSNWTITSPDDPAFRLDLADCTREHAESVLESLLPDLVRYPRGLELAGEGRRSKSHYTRQRVTDQ
jgi:hypothetical protein